MVRNLKKFEWKNHKATTANNIISRSRQIHLPCTIRIKKAVYRIDSPFGDERKALRTEFFNIIRLYMCEKRQMRRNARSIAHVAHQMEIDEDARFTTAMDEPETNNFQQNTCAGLNEDKIKSNSIFNRIWSILEYFCGSDG